MPGRLLFPIFPFFPSFSPLEPNFYKILIEIQQFSYNEMNLEMLSANWWPFCLCLNVLTHCLDQDGGDSADYTVAALSWMKTSEYWSTVYSVSSLQWHHNGRDSVSNHQPHDCLLNSLFGRRSKKTSKVSVIGLCAGNSPVTGEFPAQMASSAENVSIWWRHHDSIGFHWPYISIGLDNSALNCS